MKLFQIIDIVLSMVIYWGGGLSVQKVLPPPIWVTYFQHLPSTYAWPLIGIGRLGGVDPLCFRDSLNMRLPLVATLIKYISCLTTSSQAAQMDSAVQNNYTTLQKRMNPLGDLGAIKAETLEEHQQMKNMP